LHLYLERDFYIGTFTSLIRKRPPPQEHHRNLDIPLLPRTWQVGRV